MLKKIRELIYKSNSKEWSALEDTYIIHSNSNMLIQSLKLRRDYKTIQKRVNELSLISNGIKISKPEKLIGLRIVKRAKDVWRCMCQYYID